MDGVWKSADLDPIEFACIPLYSDIEIIRLKQIRVY